MGEVEGDQGQVGRSRNMEVEGLVTAYTGGGKTVVTSMGVRQAAGASGEEKAAQEGQVVGGVLELRVVTPVTDSVPVHVRGSCRSPM